MFTGVVMYFMYRNIMKIKQLKIVPLLLLFAISTLASSFVFSPSQTAQAIKCTNNGGNVELSYHTSDGKCYVDKNNYEYQENLLDSRCTAGGKTGDVKTDSSGKKYCFTSNEASDYSLTYDDGSPVPYVCPEGSEPHADRNGECYKVTDRSAPTKGSCPSGYEVTSRDSAGKATGCAKYEKVDKVAAPEPNKDGGTSDDRNYCQKTYVSDGKENLTKAKAACEAGMNGEDCEAQPTQALKDACNAGKAAANDERGRNPGDATGCGAAKTNLISCEGSGVSALASVLKIALFVLTIIVGIAAVGAIAYAAVLYSAGEDNSNRTSDAKNLIRNVVIGLVVYGFMIAIINWLIPGGVIS